MSSESARPDAYSQGLLLDRFNQTDTAFPTDHTLHGLLEVQAQRVPHKTALVCDGQSFSYLGFNGAANQLAHYLRQSGVKPGCLVGICLERGADLVIAIFAVLKAGGAYVPLDPLYPRERLGLMVSDSNMTHLITNAARAGSLPPHGAAIIDVHAVKAAVARQPFTTVQGQGQGQGQGGLSANASDLAYVIYTSGSTGKPKGVLVPHSCAVNFLYSMQETCAFSEDEVTLSANTVAFDISIPDLFLNFAVGATLVLAPQEASLDGRMVADLITRHRITNMLATPSTWRILIESGWEGSTRLRIIAAGEVLPKHLARLLLGLGSSLWNAYGPTEVTVIATFHQVTDPDQIYIGKAIHNTYIYLLDAEMQRVALGEIGELYIAGAGVSRGYLNRPELNAERFLPNPFSNRFGGRMYKTGDLGRYTLSGAIEYLGRSDEQVKIRGFRIELGDIEAALAAHEVIAAAVASVHTGPADDQSIVVHYVLKPGRSLILGEFRSFLAERLPQHMLPNYFLEVPALPLGPSGKIDRKALPKPPGASSPAEVLAPHREDNLRLALITLWQEFFPSAKIGPKSHFFELGGNSLLAVRMINRLRAETRFVMPVLQLFQYPTIEGLAGWYDTQAAPNRSAPLGAATSDGRPLRVATKQRHGSHHSTDMKIAVIGMALRCPGADGLDEFWQNLANGTDSISHFAPEDLDPAISKADAASPNYVAARGILKDGDGFDAAFFGIGEREAEVLDPQHRHFLETVWQALEHGGYQGEQPGLRIGVYAGSGTNTYLPEVVRLSPGLIDRAGAFQVMVANEKDYLTTRIMHRLNLSGPAVTVQTACSTSLVAVHTAVQALRLGDCDMAIAGGSASTSPLKSGYFYQEGAMLSPDGRTRTFDADACGTVFSDGVGAVLLKRLSDALQDGDHIYGVIIGTALNNDGAHKASFTAPSVEGQAMVVAQALADAGVDAASISYVEAHGTATPLGDPIEIAALTKAFRQTTAKRGYCAIGSLKSNVGHLTAAAGVAGLIKTCLSLYKRQLPPSIHFRTPNPKIDFATSPFRVNTRLTAWESADGPRRAGVSSFGVGGTNAHLIVEEAPRLEARDEISIRPQLLVYSAPTETALAQKAQQLSNYLTQPQSAAGELRLDDIAYTLMAGRKPFAYRGYVVAASPREAALNILSPSGTKRAKLNPMSLRLAWLFPGQGSQHASMGLDLYGQFPSFRQTVDACALLLKIRYNIDLIHLMFEPAQSGGEGPLTPTEIAQPALFTICFALAKLWQSLGVTPQVLLGHSVGEFAAACIAGVFSWEEALCLVAERGRLMQQMPAGAMLSVRLPARELIHLLPPKLAIAAFNSPGTQVVAGPLAEIHAFAASLAQQGIAAKLLRTSHAFHTAQMQGAAEGLLQAVASVRLSPPQIPIISTLTGQLLSTAEATSPDYWARQLRLPVTFAAALQTLFTKHEDLERTIVLEVGPGEVLTNLCRQQVAVSERTHCISSLGASAGKGEGTALLRALGELWCAGLELNPEAIYNGPQKPHRTPLPTYPFERRRYWPVTALPITAEVNSVAQPAAPDTTAMNRQQRFAIEVAEHLRSTSGISLGDQDLDVSFGQLGLDSLFLTQFSLRLQKAYGIKITFRQLLDDYATIARLARFLERQVVRAEPIPQPPTPAEKADPPPAVAPSSPLGSATSSREAPPSATNLPLRTTLGLDEVISMQLQIMTKQLELLGGKPLDATFPGKLRMAVEDAHKLPAEQPRSGQSLSTVPAATPSPSPNHAAKPSAIFDASKPPLPGARLGRDPQGFPAWYIADVDKPGAYKKIS